MNNEVGFLYLAVEAREGLEATRGQLQALRVPKQGPGKALTPEEGARLVAKARRPQLYVALCATVLSQQTGCRPAEIRTLRLADICIEAMALMSRCAGTTRRRTRAHDWSN